MPPKGVQGFYDAVRSLGGDVIVKNCERCKRRLRAKLPYEGCKEPAIVCASCDKALDFPRLGTK